MGKRDETREGYKSRTQLKNDVHELTDFGKKLVDLTEEKLKILNLDETLMFHILSAKTMQRIHLKRQYGFIGKLLRAEDSESIKQHYNDITMISKESQAYLIKAENLRTQILDVDNSEDNLTKFIKEYQVDDVQKIRQLVRAINKSSNSKERIDKSYKTLFQEIKKYINKDI